MSKLGSRALALLVGLALAGVALSDATRADTDTVYSCSFEGGAAWQVADEAFAADTPSPLAFKISRASPRAKVAELTTKTGRTDVKVVAAIDATHFIEVTVAGYLTLTTLYGDGERVPAVHSRHLGIVGQPVGGQLHGFCERT
ncbi:MAG: hypothetical protein AAGJ70_05995 [Pseudomonadota bacterium]